VRGDLLVTIRGTVPKKLSKEQRALLEQLAATLAPEHHRPVRSDDEGESESIFSKLFR
jgi:DnaJ-class molecular chaperone